MSVLRMTESRVVGKDTGYRRQIADIAVDHAEECDDRGLVCGDAVEIAHSPKQSDHSIRSNKYLAAMRRSLRMRECLLYLLNRIHRLDRSVYRPIEYLSNQLVIDRLNACAVDL